MPLETKLYTALTGSTLVTDYIASSSSVYPVLAPQNAAYPHIVYTRISGTKYNGLSGYLNAENPTLQLDIYSTSYATCKTIAGNVHTVLNGTTTFKAILVTDEDIFEDSIRLYRVSADYSFINLE